MYTYFLHLAEQNSCEGSSQGREFVFFGPRAPNANQSCQCGAIQSTPHDYKIWETHSDLVCCSIWPLEDTQLSHTPYGASESHLQSKHELALSRRQNFNVIMTRLVGGSKS